VKERETLIERVLESENKTEMMNPLITARP